MQASKHNTPSAPNGQPFDFAQDAPTIEARQFALAFCPEKTQPNITQAWSLKASEAIQTLIDFRSAVHRWQAAGQVNDAEFVTEVQRLEDVGLAGWIDELIAAGMVEVR